MKFKVKTYELKHSATPGVKSQKLKPNNDKFNAKSKSIGGIKDNRKYKNDKTLSEAEKLDRRMALENMKRKSKNINNNKTRNKLFLKDNDNDDNWENDPFLIKAKQLDQFDEGLDESSDEEPNEENTEKYFANGLFSAKKEKLTLGDKIRESKIEKYEKNKISSQDAKDTVEANEKFRKEFRLILPKLGDCAKAKSKTDYESSKVDYGAMFQKNFESLIYAQRPQRVDDKTIHVKTTEKDNDKLVNMKIKRIREYLVKDDVFKDKADQDSEIDDENDISDEEVSDKSDDISDEDGDISNENDSDVSEEDSNMESGDESENVDLDTCADDNNPVDAFKNLKKIICETSKSTKRKLEDSRENNDSKKLKLDETKHEVDCFRVILQMPDLRKDALYVLANEMNTVDISEDDFQRKFILATLFHETLKTNDSNFYSPELIGLLKFLLENSTSDSITWLSVKKNLSNVSENDKIDICDVNKSGTGTQALSMIFHILNLLISIINCYKILANKHSLFLPLLKIFEKFPTQFYPSWLVTKLEEVISLINSIRSEPVPVLRMMKNIKVIELLEAELEDKYDPAKNLTKSLKEKVKKEKKSVKKALQLNAKKTLMDEVMESRKLSKFRNEKTKEIMNTANQII